MAGARKLLDRRVQIRIGPEGVYHRQWSERTVPWDMVRAVAVGSIGGQCVLTFALDDPARWRGPGVQARIARLNPTLGFGELSIGTTGLDRRFGELVAAVEAHRGAGATATPPA